MRSHPQIIRARRSGGCAAWRRPLLVVALAAVIGACASDADDAIRIDIGNGTCAVEERRNLRAGTTTFEVVSQAGDITEVHVTSGRGSIAGEVENIAPGSTRSFEVDMAAGTYDIECRVEGQATAVSVKIVVTGSGGPAERAPTRSIAVAATDYEYSSLDGKHFARAEPVEIVMRNDAPSLTHELEIFDPNGSAAGEIGPTEPGATGRVVVTFEDAGVYTFVCGIDDHEERGMIGTFRVG